MTCEAHPHIETTLSRIEAKVDALNTALHVGNGRPSVIMRIDRIERYIDAQEAVEAMNENRLLTLLRVAGPWALGVLAVYLGLG